MAYVTDAAREYAKKKAKDLIDPVTNEKYTDGNLYDYGLALLRMSSATYKKILNIISNSIKNTGFTDFRILPLDENEYILCGFWPGASLTDILDDSYKDTTREKFIKYYDELKALITSPEVEIVSSNIKDIISAAHSKSSIRNTIRQLVIDRRNALMTMNKAYNDFMQKWDKKFDELCDQYDLGYPGAYNDYLIELQDLDDILGFDIKPLTEKEIDEKVDELFD